MRDCKATPLCVCLNAPNIPYFSFFKQCERNTEDISSQSSSHICAKAFYVLQPYEFVSQELPLVKKVCYALKSSDTCVETDSLSQHTPVASHYFCFFA